MDHQYIGDELNAFQIAHRWKRYWIETLFSVIPRSMNTIEIGSGLGGNANIISTLVPHYTGIEPDENLVAAAKEKNPNLDFISGDITTLEYSPDPRVLIYADVLEHIENDSAELLKAATVLASGSYIGILVPAHQHLFSKFDESIGHFRRYSLDSLSTLTPPDFSIVLLKELDSIGYLLAGLSKKFLNRGKVSKLQVRIWDSLIPGTKILDSYSFFPGKSVLMILRKF